ncbi:MAG: hypothetical protein Q8S39_12085 [Ignavibacteria bacterium]|nr:hypothetical protein [Ignavibacteria bacterium]
MELTVGIKVKYNYPLPDSQGNQSFLGTIEYIGESYLDIRSDKNTLLKVSYKNYDNIKSVEELGSHSPWIESSHV